MTNTGTWPRNNLAHLMQAHFRFSEMCPHPSGNPSGEGSFKNWFCSARMHTSCRLSPPQGSSLVLDVFRLTQHGGGSMLINIVISFSFSLLYSITSHKCSTCYLSFPGWYLCFPPLLPFLPSLENGLHQASAFPFLSSSILPVLP